jgi:hypothetical protein
MSIVCSICGEVYYSMEWSNANVTSMQVAWRKHYATHSWLRRKLQRLLEFPDRIRLKRFQWRTRKKFSTTTTTRET